MSGKGQLPAQLHRMHESILRMGVLVEEALQKVSYALETKDYRLAEEIVHQDRRIDALAIDIDDQCVRIIEEERPEDRHLRDVVTTIKISSALERIGDHARHIAHRARFITDSAFVQTLPTIRAMTDINAAMLQDLLTAYVEADGDRAKDVAARDREVDILHQSLSDQLIRIMKETPDNVENGLELMLVNRFLARFGDQITNMCELVVFAGDARHVELNDAAR